MRERISIILPIAIVSLGLVFASFLINVEFSAVSLKTFSKLWMFVTNTGGTIGSGVLTLLASVFLAFSYKSVKVRGLSFGILLLVFSTLLIGVAQLNEHLIKERVQEPRPNIILLSENEEFKAGDVYAFDHKVERSDFLQKHIDETKRGSILLGELEIEPIVWRHWLKETGYSFPSGHSVNAFLMAFIMSYCFLLKFKSFGKYGVLTIYFWASIVAYSRLLLGVHSSFDISFGALWGTILGLIIVSTGLFDFIEQKFLIYSKRHVK